MDVDIVVKFVEKLLGGGDIFAILGRLGVAAGILLVVMVLATVVRTLLTHRQYQYDAVEGSQVTMEYRAPLAGCADGLVTFGGIAVVLLVGLALVLGLFHLDTILTTLPRITVRGPALATGIILVSSVFVLCVLLLVLARRLAARVDAAREDRKAAAARPPRR
ncbi:MAG TPA: hypothetical protein VKY74_09165 [Chloroflexia bacterium]|nr:hypothetical protein [Chloroflexia bacterium]